MIEAQSLGSIQCQFDQGKEKPAIIELINTDGLQRMVEPNGFEPMPPQCHCGEKACFSWEIVKSKVRFPIRCLDRAVFQAEEHVVRV